MSCLVAGVSSIVVCLTLQRLLNDKASGRRRRVCMPVNPLNKTASRFRETETRWTEFTPSCHFRAFFIVIIGVLVVLCRSDSFTPFLHAVRRPSAARS